MECPLRRLAPPHSCKPPLDPPGIHMAVKVCAGPVLSEGVPMGETSRIT
jgi:hypothetical protein